MIQEHQCDDNVDALKDQITELKATIQRMKTDAGYPTHEDMRVRDARIMELETGMQTVIEREREKCAKAIRHLDWGKYGLDDIRCTISNHVND